MEAGEHVEARLVRPPPAAPTRLVRPPPRKAGALVGAALAAARRQPLAWALLAAARLLRAAAWAAPLLVAAGAWRQALSAGGDPLGALAQVLGTPAVWWSGLGVTATALLAAALVEVAGWAVGLPGLRRLMERDLPKRQPGGGAAAKEDVAGPGRVAGQGQAEALEELVPAGMAPAAAPLSVGQEDDAPLAQRFAVLVQTALVLLLTGAVLAAAALPVVILTSRTWLASYQADQSGALLASTALALVLALTLVCGLLFRLVAEGAVARAGALGERPLVAIHEAAVLVLRRPLVFLVALYLLGIAGFLAVLAFSVPVALAPPGAAGFAMRILVEIATAGAGGLLALARLGVFVGAAVAERH